MKTKELLGRCTDIKAQITALDTERTNLMNAWAHEHCKYKVGDIVDHRFGACEVRARVMDISARLWSSNAIEITLKLRVLKKDGSDSQYIDRQFIPPLADD